MTSRISYVLILIGLAAVACSYQLPTEDPNLKCGDGIEDPDEECDDGNREDEDGCDSNCTETRCGNGIITYSEECDDGNLVNEDSCTAKCRWATCGDGFIQPPEKCDDGNGNDGDGCEKTCIPSGCGNGVLAPNEICDDNNTVNGDTCNVTCTSTIATSLFVGSLQSPGNSDGIGIAAQMSDRPLMAIFGNKMYITGANTVRMVDIPTAEVKTIAGSGGVAGCVDTSEGVNARFGEIEGIATNGATLWVADSDYHVIRAIDLTNTKYPVTTAAGKYTDPSVPLESMDGNGLNAQFNELRGLTYFNGMLYILDGAAGVLQQFNPGNGDVTTIAGKSGDLQVLDGNGTAARFAGPRLMTSDSTGFLYISDSDGYTIRRFNVFTKDLTTIAGSSTTCGFVDGPKPSARLNRPRGIATDGKSVYFAEPSSQTIRQLVLDTGEISTFSGTPAECANDCSCAWAMAGSYQEGSGKMATWSVPWDVAYDPFSKWLYVSDSGNSVIRQIK